MVIPGPRPIRICSIQFVSSQTPIIWAFPKVQNLLMGLLKNPNHAKITQGKLKVFPKRVPNSAFLPLEEPFHPKEGTPGPSSKKIG